MASSFQPKLRSYVSSGVIPAYSFVKLAGADKNPTVVVCESARAYGISQNDAQIPSGTPVEVALPGGGALLKIAGNVALGNSLKATTAGAGIATTTAGDYSGAVAVEAGVSGDIIGVHVVRDQKYSADAL